MKKYVYLFKESDGKNKALFGGKGANLAEMTKIGLPVPQGFTITTEACTKYYDDGKMINDDIKAQIETKLAQIEKITGKTFGDPSNPLLVSVRSGARVSMPGMMDTILNLGLNDVVVEGLAKLTNNARFAYDSYRRFIQMFSDVVMQQDKSKYERILDEIKEKKGVKFDKDLTADDLVKVNNMIVNSNRWSKILNCAYTALRIWNKIPGQKVTYLYFPFLIELQLTFKGATKNIDGDLKMIVPTTNQTFKQIDLGDSVTTQLSNPTPIGEPSNGDE